MTKLLFVIAPLRPEITLISLKNKIVSPFQQNRQINKKYILQQNRRGLCAKFSLRASSRPRFSEPGFPGQETSSYRVFYRNSKKSTTSVWPLPRAKSIGRQFVLSLACGSARNSTKSRTVSRKPVLAASCSGVLPVLLSGTLGSAPWFSNTWATDVLPIIITFIRI